MIAIPFLITGVVSYLLGSVPFGYLLVRVATGEDVRASGSGNIGATNVARKSPMLGVATLFLDAAKGLAATYLAGAAFGGPQRHILMATAALFAVMGHLFPVWLKFRGGKGVATSFGAFVLITPKSIVCMVGIFVLFALAFRYVSLASVAAAASFPLLAWAFGEYHDPAELVIIAIVSALVIWKHRQNIGRIRAGMEPRIGRRSGQTEHEERGLDRRNMEQASAGHAGERG